MKKRLQSLFVFFALAYAHGAVAFNTKPLPEQCKTPRFEQFSLPEYKAPERKEVPPEAEFTFVLSSKVDPETIKLTAKNKKLEYTVEDKKSFYRIKSKLPAEFTGKFVRINAFVTAKLECKGKDGWLVKVSDSKPEAKAEEAKPEAEEAKPEAESKTETE